MKLKSEVSLKNTYRFFIKLLCVICAIVLTGCISNKNDKYIFRKSVAECISIQILYNQDLYGEGIDEEKIEIVYELKPEEFEEFMNDIYQLDTERDRRHPPFWGWGKYIVKVTYNNGDTEMLGSELIEYREKSDASLQGYGEYKFVDPNEFVKVLGKYCDIDVKI